MKFKKLLATTCSFLLATTSFLCGGLASAKTFSGKTVCAFMVHSGEDLGHGERDGDERDSACFRSITWEGANRYSMNGAVFKHVYDATLHDATLHYTCLNQEYPIVEDAMHVITYIEVPDVLVVVANLAKKGDEVRADITKHLDDVLKSQRNSSLYGDPHLFSRGRRFHNKEVYLDTVPVVIYGVVPKGIKRQTSNKEFVEIAKQIKLERQGNGEKDGKFKNILNDVYVLESDGTHICINMDNNSETRCVDFYQAIKAIAKDESLQPTLWPNYHKEELPRRKAEAEARRKAQAE